MAEQVFTIINEKGLHARAAAEVIKVVDSFECKISFELKGQVAPADSLIHLLTLSAFCGQQVMVRAVGKDELAALEALGQLIENRFNESR